MSAWITTAQTVLMAAAALIAGVLLRGFQTGRWVQKVEGDEAANKERFDLINRRLERAGEKMSDLTNDVNGMPERLRSMFVSQERYIDFATRTREDRDGIRKEIEQLWMAVRSLQGGPRDGSRA